MPEKVYPLECPICNISTNYVLSITDDKEDNSIWYRCNCGVLFQKDLPAHDVYNDEYLNKYKEAKNVNEVLTHTARTYAPLIEELTYGRKLLDVGFGLPNNMDYFAERGWIVKGIDVNKTFKNREDVIIGKFGSIELEDDYNLIWMNHVIEHLDKPLEALKEAYNLMPEDGVIYIATPDIDFISKTGIGNWGHFKKREHYVLWSERALVKELERIGFNIVMKRRNFNKRFVSYWDVHIIAQKSYI